MPISPVLGIPLAVGLLACAGLQAAAPILKAAQTAATKPASAYRSTLLSGYTPSPIRWANRSWRVNAGATSTPGMDHTLRISSLGRKIRFEIRNSDNDNAISDSRQVRRAELSGSVLGDRTRLPNGTPLWGAMSFNHHAWSDPKGMSTLLGGLYGQIHIGSKFGGSPALGFRRTKRGHFRVTTRGEQDAAGSVRYEAPLSFDQVHHLIYRIVLHPQRGSLTVWLDGTKIVDLANTSIGSHHADSYFNIGLYFSGGITAPVSAEYGNVVYPAATSLSSQIATPPTWPVD